MDDPIANWWKAFQKQAPRIDGLFRRGEEWDLPATAPAELGSVVGGGTGLRYSYVELALTNVERAWDQIGPVLRDGGLPPRTWLLFHDDELRSQYLGLYPESPPPPSPPAE